MNFAVFAPYLKLIHILGAFALISGVLGREIANQRAKTSEDIKIVSEMLKLSMFFTSRLVQPAGQVVLWIGIITAVAQGWPVFGFLQGGTTNWVFVSLILNIAIILNAILVMAPAGKTIGQAIGPAIGAGKITPELSAALHNPRMRNAQFLEYFLVITIILLMVLKPI